MLLPATPVYRQARFRVIMTIVMHGEIFTEKAVQLLMETSPDA
jgi:hypothetical protein